MDPAHHHYIELYNKLQRCALLNNLFGQATEYRNLHFIWVNPSCQLLKILRKNRQSIHLHVFQLLSQNIWQQLNVNLFQLTLISHVPFH